SPAVSTIDYGKSFNQTRSCSQNQARTYTHKLGSATVHTRGDSQTITEAESQSATGTKQNWVDHDSTFTAWANEGNRGSYSGWAPAPASQTANFAQTRGYQQGQYRMEQERERDTISGQIRNV